MPLQDWHPLLTLLLRLTLPALTLLIHILLKLLLVLFWTAACVLYQAYLLAEGGHYRGSATVVVIRWGRDDHWGLVGVPARVGVRAVVRTTRGRRRRWRG